jgi:hypothetical protein
VGEYQGISLSPDGRWVAATTVTRAERRDITLLPVKAGGPVRIDTGTLQLVGGVLPHYPRVGWLPGGQRILFPARQPGRGPRTFVQDIDGAGPPHAITPEGTWGSLLTEDGSRLLARDAASNAFLVPVGGDTPKPLPFLKAGHVALNFSADGRSLFLAKRGERPPAIWRMDLARGSMEIWRVIPLPDLAATVFEESIQITHDGASVAYSLRTRHDELYVVHGLH